MVPDVLGLVPSTLVRAVRAAGRPDRPPMGIYIVPPIGAGVWVEFEHGDPNYPIWAGCRCGSGRRADARARRHAGVAQHRPADGWPEHAHASAICPGPTGRIMLKSTTGAMLIVNDTGIYIQNGKGAMHHDDRPDGHDQQRRARDHLSRRSQRCRDSCFTSGPTVQCTHARPAQPIAADAAARAGQRQPVATIDRPVSSSRGCPFHGAAGAKPQPCVQRQVDDAARRACSSNGQPAMLLPAPGPAPGICQSADQIPQGPPIVGAVQRA